MQKAFLALSTLGLFASIGMMKVEANRTHTTIYHKTGKGYICDTLYTCGVTRLCYTTFSNQRKDYYANTYYVCGPGGAPNATCNDYNSGPCADTFTYALNDVNCSNLLGGTSYGTVFYCAPI